MNIEHTGRETWLDTLKGFGALLVILGHVLSGYLDAWTFPEAYYGFYALRAWIYSFHMPLFFLLSGFTFTLAYYRNGRLRRERWGWQLLNLGWTYILFALLQWGVKQLVPELVNEPYTLEDLRDMFWEPLGNFWYLYVLFVLYVLAAMVRLPGRHPVWLFALGGLSVWAAYLCLDRTQLTLYRILYHMFFFAAGSMLCLRRKYLSSPHLLGLCAMLLSSAAYFYFVWRIWNWYASWKFIIAAATSFVFLAEFYRIRPRASLLSLCGRHALELYLLHTFFTGGLRTLLPALGVVTPWLSVLVNFAASTAISLVLAVLAGKWRWTDILFRPARLLRRER